MGQEATLCHEPPPVSERSSRFACQNDRPPHSKVQKQTHPLPGRALHPNQRGGGRPVQDPTNTGDHSLGVFSRRTIGSRKLWSPQH